jgi:predicted Zn-dependent peptidase
MSEIIEEKLSNGIRVVIDPGSQAGLLSVGFGFEIGARYESQEENGLSHFLEHNAFNGTTRSTHEEIFSKVADIGADINALTSKTSTIYKIDGRASDAEPVIDILSEIVCDSVFPEEAFEKERGAVIQEIQGSKGDPNDIFHERVSSVLYPDQPLGRTILGPVENISAVSRETMIGFFEKNYNTASMIVSVAGDINPQRILQQLEERLADFRKGIAPSFEAARMADATYNHIYAPYQPQTRTSLMFQGLSELDPNFMALRLGARILGGGFTSPLFQKVRRDHGLVYSISSYASAWADSGDLRIEFSTTPENMEKTMGIVKEVLSDAAESFSEADLLRAKAAFNVGPRYQQEKVEDRMANQIYQVGLHGRMVPLEQYLETVEAPTLKDVKVALQKAISVKPTMVTMGPEDACAAYHRFTLGMS